MWESHYLFSTLSRNFECTEPLTIVCLGNSITRHPYLPDVEWYGDWEWRHQGQRMIIVMFCRKNSSESEEIPCTIVPFEMNPYCDLDSLMNICMGGGYTNKADLIVVRIGENVTDIDAFEKKYSETD